MTKKRVDEENEVEISDNIEPGSIAEGMVTLALAAKMSGNWLRVYDIRYATAGSPSKITRDYIIFPPGSVEVLETGDLNNAASNVEELMHPRAITCQAIIQFETCRPNTDVGNKKK